MNNMKHIKAFENFRLGTEVDTDEQEYIDNKRASRFGTACDPTCKIGDEWYTPCDDEFDNEFDNDNELDSDLDDLGGNFDNEFDNDDIDDNDFYTNGIDDLDDLDDNIDDLDDEYDRLYRDRDIEN